LVNSIYDISFIAHLAGDLPAGNDGDMSYAIKLERSSVRIINTANGSTVRTIGGTFTGAVVQGEEAHLTQPNGKIRVVNIRTGSTIRTI
jgi:hypothetical protein